MEKKEILEWREHLIKMFGIYHSDKQRHTDCPLCGVNLEKISDFMIEELDKAGEEGKREYFSMGMEYFSLIEDSNIYQKKGWKLPKEKAERLQILGEIFNLLKDNK